MDKYKRTCQENLLRTKSELERKSALSLFKYRHSFRKKGASRWESQRTDEDDDNDENDNDDDNNGNDNYDDDAKDNKNIGTKYFFKKEGKIFFLKHSCNYKKCK